MLEEKQEAPVPVVIDVNNILHSMLSIVEVYINIQQIYNLNGLYSHKFYSSSNFKGAIFQQKGVLNYDCYDYEEFPDEIMEALLSEPFFHKESENSSKTDGFMM